MLTPLPAQTHRIPPSAQVSRALFPKTIISMIASYSLRRFSTGNKVSHKLKVGKLSSPSGEGSPVSSTPLGCVATV